MITYTSIEITVINKFRNLSANEILVFIHGPSTTFQGELKIGWLHRIIDTFILIFYVEFFPVSESPPK